jgi:hypothetical protein
MKYILFIFFLTLLTGCQQPKNQKWHSFELVDSENLKLGTVKCSLPGEMDTFYTWIYHSDTGCSEHLMYRANSKKYEIVEETDEPPLNYPDSGFYFTISHFRFISCDTQSLPWYITQPKEQLRKENIEYFLNKINEKALKGAPKVIIDTSRTINKNVYDIFYYQDGSGKFPFNTLSFTTLFNNRFIGFTIQSNVHPRDSFYNISMDILRSISIE